MRKFTNRLIAILFFLIPLASLAQTPVTGKVLDEKGKPVADASVLLKGAKSGTKTDANGNFTINAKPGDVLVISSVNFGTQQTKIRDAGNITINMVAKDGTLDEVVVTAMDRKLNPRELTYSAPKVAGNDVQETQRENFLNALGGRVAGLSITPTGGQAGASTNIVLRGYNSLSMSNQPLFVIDGVIVDNQVIDENSNSGIGLGLVETPRGANQTNNRNNDYTNRVSDLNPNDIESITILKGPEASALYGSQAASGAIIVTTKKAKLSASKKIKLNSINYDNSLRIQKAIRFPEINTDFDMGANSRIDSTFIYYGPKLASAKQWELKDMFRTGFSQTHNLIVDFGNKNMSFKASGSFFDNQGVVPTNRYTRYTMRMAATLKISKYFDVAPGFTQTFSNNKKPLRSANGYYLNLLRWPVTDNIRDIYNSDGSKRELYVAGDPNDEFDNPLWNLNNNRSYDELSKQNYNLTLSVYPVKWITLKGIFGYETYKNDGWTFFHPESFILARSNRGQQDNFYRKYTGYNHTITATAKKSFKNWNGRLMVGTMWQDYKTSMWATLGNGIASLTDFRSFDKAKIGDSSITNPASRQFLFRNRNYNDYNYRLYRQLAYFGEIAINWNNIFFINYTHRFEEGSTLPKLNRKVNYPAGGVSLIVSDLIKPLKNSKVISYLKLRASLASTAKSNSPYSNQSVFVQQTSSGIGYGYDFTNANLQLVPEKQKTYEFGTELRLFHDRISIDATYYNTLNKDQILELFRAPYGTGFVLNTLNISSTRNQGVEISVNTKAVDNKNFKWDIGINFTKGWNKLLYLPYNIPEFYISDTWLYANARGGLVRGGPTTSITSWGYTRNAKGQVLVDPTTGMPIIDQTFQSRGDRNPDFTLGINNSFKYKNWTLSMLWDAKVGGDVFNANAMFLTQIGRHPLTADRALPRVFDGVLKDGLENTANPTKNNIVITPALNQGFYTVGLPEEYFIEKDVSYFRLRDITLSHNFKNCIKKVKFIKNLSAFVTGNNLIMISNYTGADPSVNGNTPATKGVGAFGFDYGTLPEPISVNFGIRASF
jgi:TonB-linked SusC/RagA family outer membrane protein